MKAVDLASGELSGSPFGGGACFGSVGIPGRADLVGVSQLASTVLKGLRESGGFAASSRN